MAVHPEESTNKFRIYGEFKGANGTESRLAYISRNEYIRMVNCSPEEKNLIFDQTACRHIGPELLKRARFPSVTELREAQYHNDTPFDSVESINQSLDCFKAISERLCEDFAANCGAVADAYLALVLPAGGISTGGAGGGGGLQSGWGRKKDDDDWPKKKSGLMDQHPKGRFKR